MFSDILNYISIGVVSTGLSLYVFRILRHFRAGTCKCYPTLSKTVVITGATSGLGKHCAYELANRNCNLILGCRNLVAANKMKQDIKEFSNCSVQVHHLDLLDLKSVYRFSDHISNEKIDVLINNAGIMADYLRVVPESHLEEDMSVNYYAQVLLTHLILNNHMKRKNSADGDGEKSESIKLTSQKPLRLIFIASSLAKRGRLEIDKPDFSRDPYNYMQAYSNSKLALCLFARQLDRHFNFAAEQKSSNLQIITMFTGGMVNTKLSRNILSSYSILVRPLLRFLMWSLLKDPSYACYPIVHCALTESFSGNNNSDVLMSSFQQIKWPESINKSMELSEDLWRKTCQMLNISPFWKPVTVKL